MTLPEVQTTGRSRLAWLDDVRIVVITGMVLTHVATAYVIDIGWYYEERGAHPVTQAAAWALLGVGGLFGMGLLFLVAGLVTPPSLRRKGPRRFARDRLVRLGVPLAVFVVLVDPSLDFVGSRGEGADDGVRPFLRNWLRYDADLSVMWFVAVLLAFSLTYALLRSWRPAPAPDGGPVGRPLLVTGLVVAVGSFIVRLRWPFLSDSVRGLNVWELPQMLALFALGVFAGERGRLDEGLPDWERRRCGQAAVVAGVGTLLLAPALVLSEQEAFLGGWNPRAALVPVLEGVLSVAASMWLLEGFRRRGDVESPLQRALARASYAAYLVHPAVLVALMVSLRALPVVVEVKLLVVWVLGVSGSFAVGWLLTRAPVLHRVL